MNNNSNTTSALENIHKFACEIATQCYRCFDCAQRRRIHPDRSGYQNYNKIVRFQGSKFIRVIHLNNLENKRTSVVNSPFHCSDLSTEKRRTFSFSDSEYAFMCWSKPLRLCEVCQHSFKNLWHENSSTVVPAACIVEENNVFKLNSTQSASQIQQNDMKCSYALEKFIDAFVKDVLNDAIFTCAFVERVQWSSSVNLKNNISSDVENEKSNSENTVIEHKRRSLLDGKVRKLQKKDCVMKSGSCDDDDDVFIQLRSNDIFLDCSENKDEKQAKQSREMCAYYNKSYSDAEEELNASQLKVIESDGASPNQKFSICTHLVDKSSKPILFFLHGVGCSADLWTHLLYFFSQDGYEVVAPDMLGHGFSSTPDSPSAYTFHNLLKDALDIFDKFVGEMKCVIIGHAFGCSLAAAIARYRPQQVSQLVLISGGGPTPLAPRRADFSPPEVSPLLQMCLRPLLWCGLKREILYVPCGKHIETADSITLGVPAYVLNHIARGQDWPEGDSAFHRRILVPTLLVHGMKDPYVTLVQECEMERTIPRSSLELIANAGHFAMLETPDKLCHMIQCFVNWWCQ